MFLKDIAGYEEVLKLNINVYQLERSNLEDEDKTQSEDEQITAACLLHRSMGSFTDTLNINMCENHFSYINDMDLYCKAYAC